MGPVKWIWPLQTSGVQALPPFASERFQFTTFWQPDPGAVDGAVLILRSDFALEVYAVKGMQLRLTSRAVPLTPFRRDEEEDDDDLDQLYQQGSYEARYGVSVLSNEWVATCVFGCVYLLHLTNFAFDHWAAWSEHHELYKVNFTSDRCVAFSDTTSRAWNLAMLAPSMIGGLRHTYELTNRNYPDYAHLADFVIHEDELIYLSASKRVKVPRLAEGTVISAAVHLDARYTLIALDSEQLMVFDKQTFEMAVLDECQFFAEDLCVLQTKGASSWHVLGASRFCEIASLHLKAEADGFHCDVVLAHNDQLSPALDLIKETDKSFIVTGGLRHRGGVLHVSKSITCMSIDKATGRDWLYRRVFVQDGVLLLTSEFESAAFNLETGDPVRPPSLILAERTIALGRLGATSVQVTSNSIRFSGSAGVIDIAMPARVALAAIQRETVVVGFESHGYAVYSNDGLCLISQQESSADQVTCICGGDLTIGTRAGGIVSGGETLPLELPSHPVGVWKTEEAVSVVTQDGSLYSVGADQNRDQRRLFLNEDEVVDVLALGDSYVLVHGISQSCVLKLEPQGLRLVSEAPLLLHNIRSIAMVNDRLAVWLTHDGELHHGAVFEGDKQFIRGFAEEGILCIEKVASGLYIIATRCEQNGLDGVIHDRARVTRGSISLIQPCGSEFHSIDHIQLDEKECGTCIVRVESCYMVTSSYVDSDASNVHMIRVVDDRIEHITTWRYDEGVVFCADYLADAKLLLLGGTKELLLLKFEDGSLSLVHKTKAQSLVTDIKDCSGSKALVSTLLFGTSLVLIANNKVYTSATSGTSQAVNAVAVLDRQNFVASFAKGQLKWSRIKMDKLDNEVIQAESTCYYESLITKFRRVPRPAGRTLALGDLVYWLDIEGNIGVIAPVLSAELFALLKHIESLTLNHAPPRARRWVDGVFVDVLRFRGARFQEKVCEELGRFGSAQELMTWLETLRQHY